MKWFQRWGWVFSVLCFICMMVMCIFWMMAGSCEWWYTQKRLPCSKERWEESECSSWRLERDERIEKLCSELEDVKREIIRLRKKVEETK